MGLKGVVMVHDPPLIVWIVVFVLIFGYHASVVIERGKCKRKKERKKERKKGRKKGRKEGRIWIHAERNHLSVIDCVQ